MRQIISPSLGAITEYLNGTWCLPIKLHECLESPGDLCVPSQCANTAFYIGLGDQIQALMLALASTLMTWVFHITRH